MYKLLLPLYCPLVWLSCPLDIQLVYLNSAFPNALFDSSFIENAVLEI